MSLRPRSIACAILVLAALAVPLRASARQDETPGLVVRNGEAYLTHDPDARTWTLGNPLIQFTVGLDRQGVLRVQRLVNTITGFDWVIEPAADASVTIDGNSASLGSRPAHPYVTFWSEAPSGGVELALVFENGGAGTRVARHYLCYPGAPVIEAYTTFEAIGERGFTVSDPNLFQLSVPKGEVRWLTGLDASAEDGGSFTRRRSALSSGQRLAIGADGRSSERAVPWFEVVKDSERLFGGLMWSGAWTAAFDGEANRTRASLGLPSTTTRAEAQQSIDTPHAFFGVASDRSISTSAAVRAFVEHGVRGGRPFQALVTLNTWFVNGAWISEQSMRDEVDRAARVGVEVFVVDAGWWAGAGTADQFDYHTGLGAWTADPERFPSGLRALADYVRSKGLKFGIWVEPERVALEHVGEDGGVDETWLATRDGRYDPGLSNEEAVTGQICLGNPEAAARLLDRLVTFIEQVGPDYLKWDNNSWITCTRTDHGHLATDGNFTHVTGLYRILAALRQRFPDLVIENCSGGGHRIDFGMLRYTDAAWMDDRTAPSSHVRHNLEGLAEMFPAPYLFSFVLGEATAESAEPDVALWFRSRMPGMLGLGDGALGEGDQAAREIAAYKRIREIQRDASSFALTPQVGGEGAPAPWDAIQQTSETAGDTVIFAYQTDFDVESTIVRPRWLDGSRRYRVESVDNGLLGEATGEALMTDGIEIVRGLVTDAHILILRIQPPDPQSEGAAGAAPGPTVIRRK